MGAGHGLLALLDQIGERLFHENLQLTALPTGQHAYSRKDLGINLSSKLLADRGHGAFLLRSQAS
jgi:hypothetical protein